MLEDEEDDGLQVYCMVEGVVGIFSTRKMKDATPVW